MARALKCRLLIEAGAAETRAALLVGETPVRFWFGPARGDEHLPRPVEAGELVFGRIRSVSKPLKGAFVDIGEAREAFLPFGKASAPVEGAGLAFRVTRPAIGAKGAVLAAASPPNAALAGAAPGRLGSPADAVTLAAAAFADAGVDEAVASDPAAALGLRGLFPAVSVDIEAFAEAGVDEAIEDALAREAALPGGARLVIDETEALVAIDVDAAGAADGATGRLNDKVNLAAAKELFAELSRRDVGGRIVVDFLPSSGAEARKGLLASLAAAREGLFEARFGKLSADGLFDMTAPRRRRSLLDAASEPCGEGMVRQGRRMRLDWAARRAIAALECALRRRPTARPRLLAGPAVAAYLADSSRHWTARLADRYGARFVVTPDAAIEDRSFDIAE